MTTLLVEVSLNARDSEILAGLRDFLADARKQRKIRPTASRPASFANLKRDFVVYALSLEKWDIQSMQSQLAHMGCKPFPAGTDPKHFVRKIRHRYQQLSSEIAEPTNRAVRAAFRCRGSSSLRVSHDRNRVPVCR